MIFNYKIKKQSSKKKMICFESKDIGIYNASSHNSIYCCANTTKDLVIKI